MTSTLLQPSRLTWPWQRFFRLALLLAVLHYLAWLCRFTFLLPLQGDPGLSRDAFDLLSLLLWTPFNRFALFPAYPVFLLIDIPLISLLWAHILSALICAYQLYRHRFPRAIKSPPPLTRRLLAILSALSLLLCLVIIAYWAAAHFRLVGTAWFVSTRTVPGTFWTITTSDGRFRYQHNQVPLNPRAYPPGTWVSVNDTRSSTRCPGLTILRSHDVLRRRLPGTSPQSGGPIRIDPASAPIPYWTSWSIEIAYWLPCLLFAIPPLFWFLILRRRWRYAHRLANNLCPTCGYDLRATPDRCPECGTSVPTNNVEKTAQ